MGKPTWDPSGLGMQDHINDLFNDLYFGLISVFKL